MQRACPRRQEPERTRIFGGGVDGISFARFALKKAGSIEQDFGGHPPCGRNRYWGGEPERDRPGSLLGRNTKGRERRRSHHPVRPFRYTRFRSPEK